MSDETKPIEYAMPPQPDGAPQWADHSPLAKEARRLRAAFQRMGASASWATVTAYARENLQQKGGSDETRSR